MLRVWSRLFCVLLLAVSSSALRAETAFVRVSQVGYEVGAAPARAYLMSTKPDTGSMFHVLDEKGHSIYSAKVGELLGVWSHSKSLTYQVYALDFSVPRGDTYRIAVTGALKAKSPPFAVGRPSELYPGLLLNTLFFYQTQRDGPNFIRNALRDKPGHLKDKKATQYITPTLDDNDEINEVPPAPPLTAAGLPAIDASGGWWDAGDYEKYVETMSYTVALMEIGIRDFPKQMGKEALRHPPAPPNSVSYAGDSKPGAPQSADFRAEAQFGVEWLLKMWDSTNKRLAYQVDNTQDWNYYGEGDPSSATGDCGGTYQTPLCLITEYDIWTLPQAADNYQQEGDATPCDKDTTFYICNRPVFISTAADHKISPNLAGRLAAAFALCYQINERESTDLAARCLRAAKETYALADTSYPDPAPYGSGTCAACLLTIAPFDGYPETVWDDDMELGATELYRAARLEGERSGNGVEAKLYLKEASVYAQRYISKIYSKGSSDTLNLYDVSGLAHFELHRALAECDGRDDFAVTASQIKLQLLKQVDAAITQSNTDPWGFGVPWQDGDTTSHGAGLSVMASEAYSLTHDSRYEMYSQRWLANILGANPWGTSFIVGDGSIFPNCIQHQVANLAGALNGTSGGTPVLWGAAVEGPASYATSGTLDGMILCPVDGIDTFGRFNGNSGGYDATRTAIFRDDVQSYSTTEPGIDLTATSFLMWSWRLAGRPE